MTKLKFGFLIVNVNKNGKDYYFNSSELGYTITNLGAVELSN